MPGVDVVAHATGRGFVAQTGGIRGPAEVFADIFWVFLALGTAVGVVVIAYTLYNSYKYRDGDGAGVDAEVDRPQVGELPQGGGGGKKLALSFSISAVIVVGLIIWTYGALLTVEDPSYEGESMEIDVQGSQFAWEFTYPNGTTTNTLHAPAGQLVWLNVTSVDVMHNFGIPELGAKADAIPGQYTRTWILTNETGTYEAQCYELCGAGHSFMNATVIIHTEEGFEEWYSSTTGTAGSPNAASGSNAAGDGSGSENGSSEGGHAMAGPTGAITPGVGATLAGGEAA